MTPRQQNIRNAFHYLINALMEEKPDKGRNLEMVMEHIRIAELLTKDISFEEVNPLSITDVPTPGSYSGAISE